MCFSSFWKTTSESHPLGCATGAFVTMACSRNMDRVCLALGLVILMCGTSEARGSSFGQTEVGKVDFKCDACLEFSSEAQLVLSDPEIQKQAVDYINQLACQALTPHLKTKCVDLVNEYVPGVFIALQGYLGPEICTETGLCVPEKKQFDVLEKLIELPSPGDTKTCQLCEEFAKDALTYFGSNKTKAKFLAALHLLCSRFGEMSKQCDLLVDVYAPDFMKNIDKLTPEEFCTVTHLCGPALQTAPAVRGVKRNDCAICQFVILEVKLKLKDPATQEKLVDVLLNGCQRVQNHVDECKLIVEQYAPFILANLETILDADTLCTKIGACRPSKFTAVEPFEAFLSSVAQDHVGHVHTH